MARSLRRKCVLSCRGTGRPQSCPPPRVWPAQFIRLQALDLPEHQKSGIDKLALSIFTRYSPADPATRRFSCPQCQGAIKDFDTRCGHCGHAFPACSFSGRPILDTSEAGKCKTCKRSYLKSEARQKRNCGLCHTPLPGLESYGKID